MDVGFVYMHKHARLRECGGMLPQKLEIRSSETILGQKYAIVATWLAEYCIRFLAVHVYVYIC